MAVDFYGRTVFNPADNSSFMKRLSMIEDMGNDATQLSNNKSARDKSARQNAIDLRLQQAQTDAANKGTVNQKKMNDSYTRESAKMTPPNSKSSAKSGKSSSVPQQGTADFETFKNAIAKQESGSNYSARNSMSGAMGKYQIMPSNLGGKGSGWDYEALGYDVSPSQFMKSPQIQEKVANHFLQGYYKKYGPAGAAVAWYAGPSAAKKYYGGKAAGTRGEAGGHPSVSSYIQQILDKMGL